MGGAKREKPRVLGTSPTVGSIQGRKWIIQQETKEEKKKTKQNCPTICFLNFFYWIIVICNVVLVSAVQQSESVTYTEVSTLF